MAPQGRLGAAAAGLAAGAAWFCAAGGVAGLAASRCDTLPDCLPTEPPPPRRRAASASMLITAIRKTNTRDRNFMIASGSCDLNT